MSLNTVPGVILLEGLSSQNMAVVAGIIVAAAVLIILIIVLANRTREEESAPEKPTMPVGSLVLPRPAPSASAAAPKTPTVAIMDAEPRKITLDEIFAEKNHLWVCPRCETLHPYTRERCFICGYDRSH